MKINNPVNIPYVTLKLIVHPVIWFKLGPLNIHIPVTLQKFIPCLQV